MNPEAHPEESERGPHWASRAAFGIVTGVLILAQVALALCVRNDLYWLSIPLVLAVSHLMHGQLIGFHEASHGLLRKNRTLNDVDGVLIGTFSFLSFTLYRASHQLHHAHLSTERDEEFWPLVNPGVPRWKRVIAALLELNLGLLFTPVIFLRTFLRANSPIRSKKVRRRIWAEYAVMAIVWPAFLSLVAAFDVWKYFLWMFLAPAALAANLQSWRKYIEHVGLTGQTVRGSTRSIVADGPIGKLVALSLLHEPLHGVHHQRAGVPHERLQEYKADLLPQRPDEPAPFRSYGHALLHLLRSLADPRLGPQWRDLEPKH